MYTIAAEAKNDPKCNVTHGAMGHLDPKQPPTKRKPFSAILNHPFVNRVDLILPQELFKIMQENLIAELPNPTYCQVILPLKSLLEDDFFNEYIKKGNILMLSEGTIGVNNVYHLKEGSSSRDLTLLNSHIEVGILRLHLDKESFERAGLSGEPCGVKGRQGAKPQWSMVPGMEMNTTANSWRVVEINLRLPSMLHGKKGFDRVVYAFKNVLDTPIKWLFTNLGPHSRHNKLILSRSLKARAAPVPDPLEQHSPIKRAAVPEITQDVQLKMPCLTPPVMTDTSYSAAFEDYAVETQEWISMVMLESPRIHPDDRVDPHLSRYVTDEDNWKLGKVVKVTWHGFLPSSWGHELFVKLLLALPREAWFSLIVAGFALERMKVCTVLTLPNAAGEYVLWEVD